MASLNRIVLVDTSGDEMFSGCSVLLSERPAEPTHPMIWSEPRDDDDRNAEITSGARMSVADLARFESMPEEDDDEPSPRTLRSSVFARACEPETGLDDAGPTHTSFREHAA